VATAAALERAYRAHVGVLCAVARAILGTGDASGAEDCVHDVVVRVWQAPHVFRPERGSLRAFLIVCVRNEALARKRNSARRSAIDRREMRVDLDEDAQFADVDHVELRRLRDALRIASRTARSARTCVFRRSIAERYRARTRASAGNRQGPRRRGHAEIDGGVRGKRTMRTSHPRDDLAGYALGTLDEAEAKAIEAHVARCAACASELGTYESTVAAFVTAEFGDVSTSGASYRPVALPARRAPALPVAVALAAALALAVGVLATVDVRQANALRSDETFFAAMIASHFAHAQFTSAANAPIDAKVVYDRRGSWYEVIARGIDPADRIAVAERAGEPAQERPDRFIAHGDMATLSFMAPAPVARIELRAPDGRMLASARTQR